MATLKMSAGQAVSTARNVDTITHPAKLAQQIACVDSLLTEISKHAMSARTLLDNAIGGGSLDDISNAAEVAQSLAALIGALADSGLATIGTNRVHGTAVEWLYPTRARDAMLQLGRDE